MLVIVHCTRCQVNNFYTMSMTGLFEKHLIQGTLPNVCLIIRTVFPQTVYFASVNELSECSKSWLDQETNIGEFDFRHIYWRWLTDKWPIFIQCGKYPQVTNVGQIYQSWECNFVGGGSVVHNSLWVLQHGSEAVMIDGSTKWQWPVAQNLKRWHLPCKIWGFVSCVAED